MGIESQLAHDMMMWANEDLLPELTPYLEELPGVGTILRHLLVYEVGMLVPGLANKRYKLAKARLQRALDEGDYGMAIWVHERPYRFQAMLEYFVDPSTPLWYQSADAQATAEEVWVDSENIYQHRNEWLDLYGDRPEGAVLGDREAYDALPDEVTLWRGGETKFLSWTTDPEVADLFARRAARGTDREPTVRTITVPKSEIFAFYTSRGESEALTFAGLDEEDAEWVW